MTSLRDLVRQSHANGVENGYVFADPREEALDLIDCDADVAEEIERLYPSLWNDPTNFEVAVDAIVAILQEPL